MISYCNYLDVLVHLYYMLVENESGHTSPEETVQEELEYLYARRSAIDNLIQSLEAYDRFRERPRPQGERKTA